MRTGNDFLLKQSAPRLAYQDASRLGVADRLNVGRDVQIALGPGGDQARDVGRIAVPIDEMIGASERNEALGMLRRQEDVTGILDPDRIVGGRMENKQRFMQVGDARGEVLMCDVIEEGAACMELPASELYLDFVLLTGRRWAIGKQSRDVPRIGWCVDRYHCARFGNAVRGGKDSAPPRLWPIRIEGAASVWRK